MIVRLNTALRNALLNAVLNGGTSYAILDGGSGKFYTGTPPASADNTATGDLLSTVAIPSDATTAASGGDVTKGSGVWQDPSIAATGTAGWARFLSASGTMWIDLDVSDAIGTGAIKLVTTSLVEGYPLVISTVTISCPEEA